MSVVGLFQLLSRRRGQRDCQRWWHDVQHGLQQDTQQTRTFLRRLLRLWRLCAAHRDHYWQYANVCTALCDVVGIAAFTALLTNTDTYPIQLVRRSIGSFLVCWRKLTVLCLVVHRSGLLYGQQVHGQLWTHRSVWIDSAGVWVGCASAHTDADVFVSFVGVANGQAAQRTARLSRQTADRQWRNLL